MSESSRLQSLLRVAPGLTLAVVTAVAGFWALQHGEPRPSVIDGREKAELSSPTAANVRSTDWMAAVDTYMDERLPGRDSLLAAHRGRKAQDHDRLAMLGRLSGQERRVLEALADGQSVGRIAADFVVSEATVRTQVRSILTKLGVKSQLQAVAIAGRHAWFR